MQVTGHVCVFLYIFPKGQTILEGEAKNPFGSHPDRKVGFKPLSQAQAQVNGEGGPRISVQGANIDWVAQTKGTPSKWPTKNLCWQDLF